VPEQEIVIFGAGIAGLSAAHELARRGHRVHVFEARGEPGGFFRSARLPDHERMPSEYSWHGMGPWYHNTFDIMREIPDGQGASVYDSALSRPIEFGIFPDHSSAQFYDHGWRSIPAMFAMGGADFLKWAYLMLKTWTADVRSQKSYASHNAAERWGRLLSPTARRRWRSCFGPWIGSDWTLVSLHTAGEFFRKQLMSRPAHYHSADAEGPAWVQGAGDGWLLLRGPSSEAWFQPWVDYLRNLGVQFHWDCRLRELTPHQARLQDGSQVSADHFVVAVDPFSARQALKGLECQEISKLGGLTSHGPHCQVSFRLAFQQPIAFPRERTAVVLADSEFNITLFAQEQVWPEDTELGRKVRSLWTGTACIATRPGRVFGKPLRDCSRGEFEREILVQVMDCQALNELISQANEGRTLRDFPLLRVEVWHEWEFAPLRSKQDKWVNTSLNQPYLPAQRTNYATIHLAGAHTRTEADVWSIEAAVESGRRAARRIDPEVQVLPQYRPLWLRTIGWLDNFCYRAHLPHILDLLLGGTLLLCLFLLTWGLVLGTRS
jgi:uncharacterized protein with NAD-binding domain and iron-sulfur cluster